MKRRLKNFDLASQPDPEPEICWMRQFRHCLRSSTVLPSHQPIGRDICFDICEDHLQLVFTTFDQAYLVNPNLLAHTRITSLDREKLKSWLLSQTKNLYCRQTYATASRFLDLFFMHRHNILRSEFQLLGLACLMLASKIIQSRIPAISFDVFNKERILNFQFTIMKALNFRLNPPTYITIGELLLNYWDAYRKKDPKFEQIKYWKDHEISIRRSRTFFQTLDTLDLVIYSLAYHLTDLVAYTFYIEHRRICLLELKRKNRKAYLVQDNQFRGFNELYSKNMFVFFKDLQAKIPLLDPWKPNSRIISLILKASRINPRIEVRVYKKFREQMLRQTYNEEISQNARNILRPTH